MTLDEIEAAVNADSGGFWNARTVLAEVRPEWERMTAALRAVTTRRDCGHGYADVLHVAPFHFAGPACPACSDAEYADRMQREEPCVICLAETAGAK